MLPRLTLVGLLLAAASALPAGAGLQQGRDQERAAGRQPVPARGLGRQHRRTHRARTACCWWMMSSAPWPTRSARRSRDLGADQPVRFVINTHYHFDHTDGNSRSRRPAPRHRATTTCARAWRAAASSATAARSPRKCKPAPAGALPAVTYDQRAHAATWTARRAGAPLPARTHRRGLGGVLPAAPRWCTWGTSSCATASRSSTSTAAATCAA